MKPTDVMRMLGGSALLFGLAFGNLLSNPGFETWPNDSTPEAWSVEARAKTAVAREADTCHAGTGACRLTRLVAGTGDNKGILQRVAVQPGAGYRLSTWCRDESPDVSLGILVTWRGQDSTYISSTSPRYSVDGSNWQQIEDTITSPASAAFADIILRTYGATGAPAGKRVLVDEASLDPDTPPPADSVQLWFVQDSIAAKLVAFFGAARSSIDYCCYNSSRPDVTLALIACYSRGVRVRVVTDNTRLDDSWVAYLRNAGIRVWSDSGMNSSLLMHNKFAVRDLADADSTNDWMWVASYNPNENETHADCALEIPGTALARAYRAEFEQMWGGSDSLPNPGASRFHTGKVDVLPTHDFTVGGFPAQLFFSPQNRSVDTICALVSAARSEVAFAINAYTYPGLSSAMIGRWDGGVMVFGTFDRASALDSASEFRILRAAHIPALIDSVPFGNGTLHEKVMVVDSLVTVTGSANWSNNANFSNDENTLVLYHPGLAARFRAEILTRYLEAGGTNPPAVTEPGHLAVGPARRVLSSPRLAAAAFPAATTVRDALGRRIDPANAGPGVYFVETATGSSSAVLLR